MQMLQDWTWKGVFGALLAGYVLWRYMGSCVGPNLCSSAITEEQEDMIQRKAFILINFESGGRKGKEVFDYLEGKNLGHRYNLLDVHRNTKTAGEKMGAREKLKKDLGSYAKNNTSDNPPYILVCGGDGTMGWGNKEIHKLMGPEFQYVFAPLPLGTGNDLSNVLGWSKKYPGDGEYISRRIRDIIVSNKFANLDRWKVTFHKRDDEGNAIPVPSAFKLFNDREEPEFEMLNYLSMGREASLTAKFANTRKQRFQLCGPCGYEAESDDILAPILAPRDSQLVNKLKYAQHGPATLRENHNLGGIKVDVGKDVLRELPDGTKSFVVTNINLLGTMLHAWGHVPWICNPFGCFDSRWYSDHQPARMNDGKLEISASNPSFWGGWLSPIWVVMNKLICARDVWATGYNRVSQSGGFDIHITLSHGEEMPIQLDGEAWVQRDSGIIRVEHKGQVTVALGNESSPKGIGVTFGNAKAAKASTKRSVEGGDSETSPAKQTNWKLIGGALAVLVLLVAAFFFFGKEEENHAAAEKIEEEP